jgi:predicted nucleic acid-binding protein
MATVKTFYVIEATNWDNTHFSMQTSELNEIDTDCSHQELAKQVRNIWRENSYTRLEALYITPLNKFSIFHDEDENEEYLLEVRKKQRRSKREDLTLYVGVGRNNQEIVKWQEPLKETA